MLRRLHHEQPESFRFTPENAKWAKAQIAKYPSNRAQSAIIPLLWRAQEQMGWLSRPAIETIADMLGMAYMRALEVATFYFMFQLQPVGKIAHFQICGTTSCMIMGSEDLISVCKRRIADNAHELSNDGNFSWEEVECLGACTNAPMAQIGKDYYEDLTPESFEKLIDAMADGKMPVPGPQNGRFAAEPLSGATSLKGKHVEAYSASAAAAVDLGDSIARILNPGKVKDMPEVIDFTKRTRTGVLKTNANAQLTPGKKSPAKKPNVAKVVSIEVKSKTQSKPQQLKAARNGKADDLKLIIGVGPKLEALLHSLGFFHFDQIANWTRTELAWVDENLAGFKGRIERDEWQAQAKKLAKS